MSVTAHSARAHLSSLPNELLYMIIDVLADAFDIYALSRTCHALHQFAYPIVVKARDTAFKDPIAPPWMNQISFFSKRPKNFYSLKRDVGARAISLKGDPASATLFCWAMENRLAATCITRLYIDFGLEESEDHVWLMGLGTIPQNEKGRPEWDLERWGEPERPQYGWYRWPADEKAGYQARAAQADELMKRTGLTETIKLERSVYSAYRSNRLPPHPLFGLADRFSRDQYCDVPWYTTRASALLTSGLFDNLTILHVSAIFTWSLYHQEMIFMLLRNPANLPKMVLFNSLAMGFEIPMLSVLLQRPELRVVCIKIENPNWVPHKTEDEIWAEQPECSQDMSTLSSIKELKIHLPMLTTFDWLIDIVRLCPMIVSLTLLNRLDDLMLDDRNYNRPPIPGREEGLIKFYRDIMRLLGSDPYRHNLQVLWLDFRSDVIERDAPAADGNINQGYIVTLDPCVPWLRGFANLRHLGIPYSALLGRDCLNISVLQDPTCLKFIKSISKRLPPKLHVLTLMRWQRFSNNESKQLLNTQARVIMLMLDGIVRQKKKYVPMLEWVSIETQLENLLEESGLDFIPICQSGKTVGLNITEPGARKREWAKTYEESGKRDEEEEEGALWHEEDEYPSDDGVDFV